MYTTFQYRIKDSSSKKKLTDLASKVNLVWNYCNSISNIAWRKSRKWMSAYDMNPLVAGSSKELGLFSSIIQCVAHEHARRRNQFKRSKLKWRSNKKSLGWIPMDTRCFSIKNDTINFNKLKLRIWKHRELSGDIRTASVNQNSRGQWFVNIQTYIENCEDNILIGKDVGIDLGLINVATCSDGVVFNNPKPFKQYAIKLARAQKANKKRLATKIHNKIANIRKDFNHKITSQLIKENDKIFVGGVSVKAISKLSKGFAKSVTDAAWGQFRTMLKYKSIRVGKVFEIVNEAWSSITCCGCLKRSGPSGLGNLGVRQWVCSSCGRLHDRDINAAINILNVGYGFVSLSKREAVQNLHRETTN